MTPSFSQPNQSVLAGIECLQWLASSHHPISNIEMARRMNVDRNRANRLLKSLVMAGMAQQTPDRKFIVGNGFHALAAQSLRASGILGLSLPSLESLRRFQGIVALGVLWKREVAYLYHSSPNAAYSPISSRESISATESSIGMMLLARLPAATLDFLFRDGKAAPFADLAELKSELMANRARGFARIYTPHPDKPSSISEAVAITQRGEYVAAIALSDVPERFPSEERVAALRTAAADIEAALKAQPV